MRRLVAEELVLQWGRNLCFIKGDNTLGEITLPLKIAQAFDAWQETPAPFEFAPTVVATDGEARLTVDETGRFILSNDSTDVTYYGRWADAARLVISTNEGEMQCPSCNKTTSPYEVENHIKRYTCSNKRCTWWVTINGYLAWDFNRDGLKVL